MNSTLVDFVAAPPIVEFKKKAAGVTPVCSRRFDMTQAVPNVPTPLRIRKRLAEALLADPEISFYTDVPGLDRLRARIAGDHPLSDSLRAENLIITAGANNAMFSSFVLHFRPGDKVLLLEPYYFNYDMGLRMLGMIPAYFALSESGGFSLRARDLIEHLERESPSGVVLISPNNPTGAVYPSSEILTLLEWTSRHRIEMILDETYAKYDPDHLRNPEIGTYLGRGLTLVGSFSKTYSLTGYRVGYLAAGREEIEQALKIQDTALICAPHISQLAALGGLEEGEEDLASQLAKTTGLCRRFREIGTELRAFSLPSCGAFFAYLKHPHAEMACEDATLRLYEHTGIAGLPGTVFGAGQRAYIRLAFCNLSPDDLEIAGRQLLDYDRTLSSLRHQVDWDRGLNSR